MLTGDRQRKTTFPRKANARIAGTAITGPSLTEKILGGTTE